MRVTKAITITIELARKVKDEADKTNRSFSNMVEHILRSHYTEKDRLLPDHNENQRNL